MKERLLREGFPDWTRNDYHQFIRACEQLGRGDVAAIVHSVTVKTGKSEEEVQRYYDVFWEKWGRKRGLTFRCAGNGGIQVVFSHELRRAKQSCHGRMEWNR